MGQFKSAKDSVRVVAVVVVATTAGAAAAADTFLPRGGLHSVRSSPGGGALSLQKY